MKNEISNEELLIRAESCMISANNDADNEFEASISSAHSLRSIASSLLVVAREMSTKGRSGTICSPGFISEEEYRPDLARKWKFTKPDEQLNEEIA